MENNKDSSKADHQKETDDLLREAIDDLENQDKLNLTSDAKDEDEALDPATEEEFAKFMSELNTAAGMGSGGETDQFAKMMADLMKGPMGGDAKEGEGNPLKSVLDGLLDNIGKGDFDSVAQNLLREFMDKDILQEPLEEAKKNYEDYFAKNEAKTDQKELQRFKDQYNCILELIEVLEKEPENKDKMISTFEKMHDYGLPPEGILNPLTKIQQGAGGGGSMPNMNQMPNMNPNECNIF